MPRAKTNKYLQLLETDLALERKRSEEQRKDLEYYRAKVERLELALRSAGAEPPKEQSAPQVPFLDAAVPRRVPFSELKRRWMGLTEAEQNKIMEEGSWDAQVKEEETNAGK